MTFEEDFIVLIQKRVAIFAEVWKYYIYLYDVHELFLYNERLVCTSENLVLKNYIDRSSRLTFGSLQFSFF